MAIVQQFFPTFFYNGVPMSGGTINFYKNSDRVTTQSAYPNSGGTDGFVSRDIDENGQVQGTPQLYLDDTLSYYVEVLDSSGVVQYSYIGLPNSAGGGSTTNSFNTENLVPNPQFYQHRRDTLTIVDATPLVIGPPNWKFLRTSSAAPTDALTFETDLTTTAIGKQAKSTPSYWLEYNKSTAGTSVTAIKIYFRYPTVRALAGEAITFKCDVYADQAMSFNFFSTQNYGTGGGGGPTTTTIGTVSIASGEVNAWQTKSVSATVTALANTIVDLDDFVEFGIDLTGLYAASSGEFRMTNFQLFLGSDTITYDWSPVWYDASTSIPTPDPALDDGKILQVNNSGYYELTEPSGTLNKIWGGDFSVNPFQEGTSFTVKTADTYIADGYEMIITGTLAGGTTFGGTKDSSAPTFAQADYNTANSLRVGIATAAHTLNADNLMTIRHVVEGYDAKALYGKVATLSFWVYAKQTDTYYVALRNNANDRQFIKSFTVDTTGIWEYKQIEITAITIGGGTAFETTTSPGIIIDWVMVAGSTYVDSNVTEGIWEDDTAMYATATVNGFDDSTADDFQIALPVLNSGNASITYTDIPEGAVLAKAHRYLERTIDNGLEALLSANEYTLTTTPAYMNGLRNGRLIRDQNALWLNNAGGDPADAYYPLMNNESFQATKRIQPAMYSYSYLVNSVAKMGFQYWTTTSDTTDSNAGSGLTGVALTIANWAFTSKEQVGVPYHTTGSVGTHISYHWIADARF